MRAKLLATALVAAIVCFFIEKPIDETFLLRKVYERATNEIGAKLTDQLPSGTQISLSVDGENADELKSILLQKNSLLQGGEETTYRLNITIHRVANTIAFTNEVIERSSGLKRIEFRYSDRLAAWTAVLPPIIAVFFAIITKRLLLSLLFGIFLGAFFLSDLNPFIAAYTSVERYLIGPVIDQFHGTIFVFTASLIAMVAVINHAGGIQGVLDIVVRFTRSARRTRFFTFLLGLAIFFDDYANAMVIGTTMRPITDKFRICREKLAYLVDSTSAPIAGLSIVSTWIGYEVGLIDEIFRVLGITMDGYAAFLSMLPFRFYCLFTIVFVATNTLSSRDFGPMYQAEHRSLMTGNLQSDHAKPLTSDKFNLIEAKSGIPTRWFNAIIPVATVISCTVFGILLSGGIVEIIASGDYSLFSLGPFRKALAETENSSYILAFSGVLGLVIAAILAIVQRILSIKETVITIGNGLRAMYFAFAILILAWGLAAVTSDLGTAHYLYAALADLIPPNFIPVLTFVLAMITSFCTGSSWTTMALLLPTMVPLANQIGDFRLVIISMAAVLDGAIFGDHCSPISDTTILSSISSSCDHMDHVNTQMPYALATMLVTIFAGYIPASFGLAPSSSYLIGIAAIILMIFLIGRNPEKDT